MPLHRHAHHYNLAGEPQAEEVERKNDDDGLEDELMPCFGAIEPLSPTKIGIARSGPSVKRKIGGIRFSPSILFF